MSSTLTEARNITSQPVACGGLADIYRATLADGSLVAVKRLRQRPESDHKELKRAARELDAWSKLDHPNILKLFGILQLHGSLSMVSPWIKYGNVVSVVNKWPSLVDRYDVCTQLVNAIAYLHSPQVDVVHGDIKGDNVLLDSGGRVKLTDFGLAIMHDQAMRYSRTDPGGGTTRWMAPELFNEGARCRETDVYALGMTILEIITGQVPFSEITSIHVVIRAVCFDKRIPDVSRLRANLSLMEANLMIGALPWCWRYEASERITATKLKKELQIPSRASRRDYEMSMLD